MRQETERWVVETSGAGFVNLTARLEAWIAAIKASRGLVTLFARHTSCSLTIQENADPDVLRDLAAALMRSRRAPGPITTAWRAQTTCQPTSRRC